MKAFINNLYILRNSFNWVPFLAHVDFTKRYIDAECYNTGGYKSVVVIITTSDNKVVIIINLGYRSKY